MQIAINHIPTQAIAQQANPAKAIARKEATQKILLFVGILTCLVLAVNI